MIPKPFLLVIAFITIAVPTFTQITKGSKTLTSSYFSMEYSYSKYAAQNITEYNRKNAHFSIGLPAYMVSDRLQIGSSVNIEIGGGSVNYTTPINNQSGFNFTTGLYPTITYYFTRNKSFFINLNGSLVNEHRKTTSSANPSQNSDNSDFNYTYNINAGYILPINENVYWQGRLGYNYQKGYENISLSVGLTNFVRQMFPKQTDETPQYISKGRSILSGDLSVSVSTIANIRNNYASVSLSRLKFRNEHLAFGGYGAVSLSNIGFAENYGNFSGGALARYYIPMSKRWFIYPELGLGADVSFGKNFHKIRLDFRRSVGLNYFITPNIAFDANLNLNFDNDNSKQNSLENYKSTSFNTSFSLGLTYFVDKIFKLN